MDEEISGEREVRITDQNKGVPDRQLKHSAWHPILISQHQ